MLHLHRGDEPAQGELTPRLAASDLEILHDDAVGGMGITLIPAYQCLDDLRAHRLERVLRDWDAPAPARSSFGAWQLILLRQRGRRASDGDPPLDAGTTGTYVTGAALRRAHKSSSSAFSEIQTPVVYD